MSSVLFKKKYPKNMASEGIKTTKALLAYCKKNNLTYKGNGDFTPEQIKTVKDMWMVGADESGNPVFLTKSGKIKVMDHELETAKFFKTSTYEKDLKSGIIGVESISEMRELKRNREFSKIMRDLSSKYGLESSIFNPRRPGYIGFEDLEQDLNNNEEYEDEAYAPEEAELPEDGGSTEEASGYDAGGMAPGEDYIPGPMEDEPAGSEYGELSSDGQFGMTDNSDYVADGGDSLDDSWGDEVSVDDMKSDADCVNMLKLIGNYVNDYTLNFESILKQNKDIIDYSGDFKMAPMYNEFVNPSITILEKVYKDSQDIMKHVTGLRLVLEDKRKMMSITGKPDNPFIYEGAQLVMYELLRSLLALVPFSIKNTQTLEEVIDSMKLNVVKVLIQMAADIIEVAPTFGTKIYYVEPIESEITGKSEELANTPYRDIDVFKKKEETMTGMQLAGESIMNLVEIKNNKALVEFSILNKMMVVITGLVKDLDISNSCKEALRQIVSIMNSEDEAAVEAVDSAVNYFRSEVLQKQIQVMADLAAEENSKLVEEPEVQETPTDNSTSQEIPDMPGPMDEEEETEEVEEESAE